MNSVLENLFDNPLMSELGAIAYWAIVILLGVGVAALSNWLSRLPDDEKDDLGAEGQNHSENSESESFDNSETDAREEIES